MRRALMMSACAAALATAGLTPVSAQDQYHQRQSQQERDDRRGDRQQAADGRDRGQTDRQAQDRQQAQDQRQAMWQDRKQIAVLSLDDMVGQEVYDQGGARVGTIDYVLLDHLSNQVRFVAIDADALDDQRDGMLKPVPWDAMDFARQNDEIRLKTSLGRLRRAQGIDEDEMDQLLEPQRITAVYDYWAPVTEGRRAGNQRTWRDSGQDRLQNRTQGRDAMEGQPQDRAQTQNRDRQQDSRSRDQRQDGQDGRRTQDRDTDQQARQQPRQGGRQAQQQGRQQGQRQAQGRGETQADTFVLVSSSVVSVLAPGYRSFQELDGADVLDANGEDIGDIGAVIVDRRSGRVVYATIVHGGILGIGEEQTPIPLGALSFDLEEEAYRLPMTEEQFANRDMFDTDDIRPRRVSTEQVRQLYRDFNVDMPTRGQS